MWVTCQRLGCARAGPLPGSLGTVSLFVCAVSRPAASAARLGLSLFSGTSCCCRGSQFRDPFQQPWKLSGSGASCGGCSRKPRGDDLEALGRGVPQIPHFLSKLTCDKNNLVSIKTSSRPSTLPVSRFPALGCLVMLVVTGPWLPTRVRVAEPTASHGAQRLSQRATTRSSRFHNVGSAPSRGGPRGAAPHPTLIHALLEEPPDPRRSHFLGIPCSLPALGPGRCGRPLETESGSAPGGCSAQS